MRKAPITVLIAEDDPDDRELTREAFEANDVATPVCFVENGEQVMEYVTRTGRFADTGEVLPSLILLDLNMPRKDGRETLLELKQDIRFRHIPVVILTSSSAAHEVNGSYSHGASSFITKPITFDGLVDVVAALGRYWLHTVQLPRGVA